MNAVDNDATETDSTAILYVRRITQFLKAFRLLIVQLIGVIVLMMVAYWLFTDTGRAYVNDVIAPKITNMISGVSEKKQTVDHIHDRCDENVVLEFTKFNPKNPKNTMDAYKSGEIYLSGNLCDKIAPSVQVIFFTESAIVNLVDTMRCNKNNQIGCSYGSSMINKNKRWYKSFDLPTVKFMLVKDAYDFKLAWRVIEINKSSNKIISEGQKRIHLKDTLFVISVTDMGSSDFQTRAY